MTNYQNELFLRLAQQLPIRYKSYQLKGSDYFIIDLNNDSFLLKIINKNDYLIYLELIRLKKFSEAIFIKRVDHDYLLLFKYPYYKSELKPSLSKLFNILEGVYKESELLVSLKKEEFRKLNSIYKVLDNKFSYFELRIREIETSLIKDDMSWIILSNYYVLLDSKVILYDLQQDIFNLIDKNTEVSFGIILKDYDIKSLYNNKIIPSFNIYFGPISMLYLRLFFNFNEDSILELIYNKIQKLDVFNKKYFVFMAIYIYILNINFETFLNNTSISAILEVIKPLKKFIKKYYTLIK